MNREELIADARRDISDAERCQALHVTPATGTILRRLREVTNALAVFEKAHVPTDDEREALNTLYWQHPDGHTTGLSPDAIDAILAAGFHLTKMPSPQGEPSVAQVEAAARRMFGATVDSMSRARELARTALRAAGGVR